MCIGAMENRKGNGNWKGASQTQPCVDDPLHNIFGCFGRCMLENCSQKRQVCPLGVGGQEWGGDMFQLFERFFLQ